MKRNNKKGFTIIELVVVIAVIAILAAVLIPTFSNIIKKANQSVDTQAVQQMNTLLATHVDGSIKNVSDAIKALDEEDIDLDNYKALQKDHYFYFVMNGNTPMIIYTDATGKILYPEVTLADGVQRMSLSGDIPMYDDYTITGNSVSIANGGQFADFMVKYSESAAEVKDVTKIALTADVDLMGCTASFGEVDGKNITLDGGGHTIFGLRADSNSVHGSQQGKPKDYGFGLFNYVTGNTTIEVKDLTIKNVIAENTKDKASGHSGLLFGSVQDNVTIKVENVTIEDCTVYGCDKVGSLIGRISGSNASATFTNVNVKNTKLYGLGYVAVAIGCVGNPTATSGSTVPKTIKFENCSFTNVTTAVDTESWSDLWYDNDISFLTNKALSADEVKAYLESDGNNNTYLPWLRNGSGNKQLGAMCTDDYYWYDNSTHDKNTDGSYSVKEAYKVVVAGYEVGYKDSSSKNIGE